MASISEAMDQIIYVGVAIFILILLLSFSYNGLGTAGNIQLQQGGFQVIQQGTTKSQGAFDFNVLSNSVILENIGGSDSWISVTTPLYITVTGETVTTVATNTVIAVNSVGFTTLTFVVNSISTPITLTTSGNFYSINTITLTTPYGATTLPTSAYPSITANVAQVYYAVKENSAPVTFSGNTQAANEIANVILGPQYGAYANFSTYGSPLPNTFGGALQLAVFALVFIAVILAVVGALRGGGIGASSGGFLGG